MGKIAFVFSGQGDQYPGMGRALYERYEAAARAFEGCEALRPGTMAQCFTGTAEELRETVNTQPCLFAMEWAAAQALQAEGIFPDAAAGFSLGEVTAAAVAGMLDGESAFRLVCRRAALMQREAEKYDTAMAAVVKLPAETVKELCGRYNGIYPVNFNCPGQITVSGLASQMPDFSAAVREAGGRAIPLKVKGAFHSPFMEEAARDFAGELARTNFHPGKIPLYSNVTAAPYGDNAAELLARQITSPVQWEQLVRRMIADGVDTFLELGPGRTLGNMIKKISGEVAVYSVAELDVLLSEVKPC